MFGEIRPGNIRVQEFMFKLVVNNIKSSSGELRKFGVLLSGNVQVRNMAIWVISSRSVNRDVWSYSSVRPGCLVCYSCSIAYFPKKEDMNGCPGYLNDLHPQRWI